MRGYGRDYDDRDRYLSGGNEFYRDRMRHDPRWDDREYGSRGYDFGGGYGAGGQWGDAWRDRDFGADRDRGYSGYDREMLRRPDRQQYHGMSRGRYGMDRGPYGYGMRDSGMGGYPSGSSFTNPTSRGDYFLGYGGSIRRGYSPFWW